MHPLEYPQLETDKIGRCVMDNGRTRTQLPCGKYMCPVCVRHEQERGWLDANFEYTEAYFAAHPGSWSDRLRRKVGGQVVLDPVMVAAELRRMIERGESIGAALWRFQFEARVKPFQLVPAVASVLGVELREARRLVAQALSSEWHRGPVG